MARKPFLVNDVMREKVRYLAGLGVPQDGISKIIECAPKTLRRRFREDLDRGAAEAIATIAGCLFLAAKRGNVTAMIFLMKTRAHWCERRPPDELLPRTDTEANSRAVVVLPDNNRDPELTRVLQQAQEKYFAKKQRPVAGRTKT
jgi:hypothetical protein